MKKSLSFLAVVIILLFVSCDNSKQTNNGGLKEVEIGYSRLRISLPVFVAKEKGIFEKNGIDAKLTMFETAQPLMQALVAGKIDVGGYTALPITYNGMIRSKKELYFVTTMEEDSLHRISYLLRKKRENGQSAEIGSIEDLKGKTIGILPTSAYKAWISEILRANGVDPEKDVVIQQIAPPQQLQALKSGGVDALFTNDPAATTALVSGVAESINNFVEVPKYIMSPFPFGSFNVSKEWGDQNPELFLGIIKSLNEAIDYIESHQKDAKLSMQPYLPEQFKDDVLKYPDVEYDRTDESDDAVYIEIAKRYFQMGIISEEIRLEGLVIEK